MSPVERPPGATGSTAGPGPAASAAPAVEAATPVEAAREVLPDRLVRRRSDEVRRLEDEERNGWNLPASQLPKEVPYEWGNGNEAGAATVDRTHSEVPRAEPGSGR